MHNSTCPALSNEHLFTQIQLFCWAFMSQNHVEYSFAPTTWFFDSTFKQPESMCQACMLHFFIKTPAPAWGWYLQSADSQPLVFFYMQLRTKRRHLSWAESLSQCADGLTVLSLSAFFLKGAAFITGAGEPLPVFQLQESHDEKPKAEHDEAWSSIQDITPYWCSHRATGTRWTTELRL